MENEKISKLTNLNKEELEIYELAIVRGYITVSMGKLVNKKKAELIINNLEEKGLLKKIPGIIPRYFSITPVNDFIKNLDAFSEDMKQINTNLLKIQKNQEKLKSELNSDSKVIITGQMDSALTNITDSRNSANNLLSEKINASTKTLTDLTQQVKSNIINSEKPSIDSLINKTNATIVKAEGTVKTKIDQNKEQLRLVIDTLKEGLLAQQEKATKEFTDIDSNIQKDLGDIKKGITDSINILDEQTSKAYTDTQNIVKENIVNSASSISQSLKHAEETSKNIINSAMDNADMLLKTADSDIKKRIEKTQLEITNTRQSLFTSLDSTHNSLNEKINTKVNDLMTETTTKSKNLNTELNTKSEELTKKSVEEIKNNNTNWNAKLSAHVNKGIDILRDGSTSLKNVISSSIQSEIEKFKEEISVQLEKIQAQYLERIETNGKEFENAFKNNINDKIVDLRVLLQKTAEELNADYSRRTVAEEKTYNNFGTSITTNIKSVCDTINESFRTLLKENAKNALENFDAAYTENKLQTQNSISSSLELLKTLSNKLSEQIINSQNSVNKGLSDESGKLLSSVDERVVKLKELSENTLINQEKIIQESITKTTTNINSKIELAISSITKAEKTIKNTVNKFSTGININVESIPIKINEIFDPTMDKLNEFMQTLKIAFTAAAKTLQTNFSGHLKESSSSIEKQLQKLETDLSSVFSNVQNTIKEAFIQLGDLTNNASDQISTAVIESNVNIQNKLFDNISEISDSLKTTIKNGKNSVSKPKEVLMNVWDKFIESNIFDSEKTWIIVGQDEIMEYLEEMVGNVKSSGFILVPRFKDLEGCWKDIMAIHKKGRKFVICTQLETADPKKINDAFESGIELFSYPEKDFICFSRDNEEILIAPISAEEDETTAIISEISSFVKHFSSMFNDYWRRVGKKYQIS
ncbi:MAG: hypothetical protein ACTSWY_05495 [Promethearchaeota archaeon]